MNERLPVVGALPQLRDERYLPEKFDAEKKQKILRDNTRELNELRPA